MFPLEWTDPKTKEISRGYREDGFFAESVINFLALLGWNPGTEQEIFSLDELIHSFSLDRVHKGGARFDPDKTRWFNHHYLQEQSDLELAKAFTEIREEISGDISDYTTQVVSLIKERAHFVSEFWSLAHYFYQAPVSYDEKALRKAIKPDTSEMLNELSDHILSTSFDSTESVRKSIRTWIETNDLGFGKVMMPLRLSLVGALQGPDVFDIMYMIGKEESRMRIASLVGSIP